MKSAPVDENAAEPKVSPGLSQMVSTFTRKHGEGVIMEGLRPLQAMRQNLYDYPRLPSYILPFDVAVGGGIPLTVPVQFFGPFEGGKSSMALIMARALSRTCMNSGCMQPLALCRCETPKVQKTFWCGFESPPDEVWFRTFNYEPEGNLFLAQPECAEDGFTMCEKAMQSPDCGLVIVDSLGAIVPRAEMLAEYDDSLVGNQAKLISRFMRKMKSILVNEMRKGHPVGVILINQIRAQIGGGLFAPAEGVAGGHVLRHMIRLSIRFSQLSVEAKEKDTSANMNHVLRFSASMLGHAAKTQVFIGAGKAEYRVAVAAHDDYPPGAVLDFSTASKLGRELGVIEKAGNGYRVVGTDLTFAKLTDMEYVFKTGCFGDLYGVDDAIRFLISKKLKEMMINRILQQQHRRVVLLGGQPVTPAL